MTFQQYMRDMMTHLLTKTERRTMEDTEKREKPNSVYHQWFGLIPLSIKLFTSK